MAKNLKHDAFYLRKLFYAHAIFLERNILS